MHLYLCDITITSLRFYAERRKSAARLFASAAVALLYLIGIHIFQL